MNNHNDCERTWMIKAVLLTLLVTVICFISSTKTRHNEIRRGRFLERNIRTKNAVSLGEEVVSLISVATHDQISEEDFRELIGELRPVGDTAVSKESGATHVFYHPESQRTFYLTFKDRILQSCSSGQSPADIETSVVLEPPEYLFSENIRKLMVGLSVFGWLLAFILSLIFHRWNKFLSDVLLILAVICTLGLFLAPNYSQTLRGIRSNDALGFGILMIVVSLACGYVFHRTTGSKERPTPHTLVTPS